MNNKNRFNGHEVPMLTKKKLAYFRKLLSSMLEEVSEPSGESVKGISESQEISPDFTDQATVESDLDFAIHMKERDSKLAGKIRSALDRIDEGSYGICESCGEDISEKRLKARPVTTLCINCKRAQEADEEKRGL
jgi:DnaK suppressor protein